MKKIGGKLSSDPEASSNQGLKTMPHHIMTKCGGQPSRYTEAKTKVCYNLAVYDRLSEVGDHRRDFTI